MVLNEVITNLPLVKREKCSSIVSVAASSTAGLLSFCQICSSGQRCAWGLSRTKRRFHALRCMRYP